MATTENFASLAFGSNVDAASIYISPCGTKRKRENGNPVSSTMDDDPVANLRIQHAVKNVAPLVDSENLEEDEDEDDEDENENDEDEEEKEKEEETESENSAGGNLLVSRKCPLLLNINALMPPRTNLKLLWKAISSFRAVIITRLGRSMLRILAFI